MSTTLKWTIGIIVALVLVGIGFSRQGKPSPNTIKIGVIAPLTGGASVFGNSLVSGIKLADADLAGTKNHYELIVEDDGGNQATAASVAQKLVNVDKVQGLITVTSLTGNAAKPIAIAGHVTHICVCADTTIGNGVNAFNNLVLPNDEAAAWVRQAQKHNAHRVAIFIPQQAGVNTIADALKAKLASAGITLTYEDRFDPSLRDFRTSIGKARATNPDTYFMLAFPPQLDILGQEFADLKITNVASIGGFPLSATPSLFEGKWFTDAALTDPAFMARFEAAYPDTKFNVRTAPQGYDSYTMLVRGFEQGDASKYIEQMTGFEGKSGTLTKAVGEGAFHAPAGLYTITNGRPTPLAQ